MEAPVGGKREAYLDGTPVDDPAAGPGVVDYVPAPPASYECPTCKLRVPRRASRCSNCRTLGWFVPSELPPHDYKPHVRGKNLVSKSSSSSSMSLSGAIAHFATLSSKISVDVEGEGELEADDAEAGDHKGGMLGELRAVKFERYASNIDALDHIFGSEDDPGHVVRTFSLLAGPPGTYKTTLLLEWLAAVCHHEKVKAALFVSEMPPSFYTNYAERLGLLKNYPDAATLLRVEPVGSVDQALEKIDRFEIELFGLDSLSDVSKKSDEKLEDCAKRLRKRTTFSPKLSRVTGASIVHGTKDGDMSGPQSAKHECDAMYLLEFFDPKSGEPVLPRYRKGFIRMLSEKNRFSPSFARPVFRIDKKKRGLVVHDDDDQRGDIPAAQRRGAPSWR